MKNIIFAVAFATVLMAPPAIAQEPTCTELVRPDLCDRLEKMGRDAVPLLRDFLSHILEQGRVDLNTALDEMLKEFEALERNTTPPKPIVPSTEI